MAPDGKLLGWAVAANISDHLRGGRDDQRFYQGTPMFSPGAKVYLGHVYWGIGGERLHVVGLRRVSRAFLNGVVNVSVLANLRVATVYAPRLWNTLDRLQAARFETEAAAQDFLNLAHEAWHPNRPQKLASGATREP